MTDRKRLVRSTSFVTLLLLSVLWIWGDTFHLSSSFTVLVIGTVFLAAIVFFMSRRRNQGTSTESEEVCKDISTGDCVSVSLLVVGSMLWGVDSIAGSMEAGVYSPRFLNCVAVWAFLGLIYFLTGRPTEAERIPNHRNS